MHIIMPKLGLTMTHGTITEWLKAPGDAVKAEEALCAYETEKVTLELTAPADGVLAEILVSAGMSVPAGAPVCVFEPDDGRRTTNDDGRRTTDDGRRSADDDGRRTADGGRRSADDGLRSADDDGRRSAVDGRRSDDDGRRTTVGGRRSSVGGRFIATPKARALAAQLGVDLGGVAGSGPDGRIQAADVQAAHAAAQPAPLRATPLARRIAAAQGLDLHAVAGTGPDGTITREDVEQAIRGLGAGEQGSRGAGEQESGVRSQGTAIGNPQSAIRNPSSVIPLTALRRTIGQRMSQSAFTAPHVTLMTEAEATNLVSARAQLNEELARNAPETAQAPGTPRPKISFNALLAALVARALREHPRLNSRLEADGIHLLPEINLALAVDTERGLMTPVLRNVDHLGLPAIQRGYDDLVARALAGKSLPDDFEEGTFTLTNLGTLDIDGFTPIINPPQAAILGIGRIVEKPVARDGAVVVRPMLTLSLSFDHRIVDGAPAGRFLQRIKQLVERPMALLV